MDPLGKKRWTFIRVPYMNPTILVPTLVAPERGIKINLFAV